MKGSKLMFTNSEGNFPILPPECALYTLKTFNVHFLPNRGRGDSWNYES